MRFGAMKKIAIFAELYYICIVCTIKLNQSIMLKDICFYFKLSLILLMMGIFPMSSEAGIFKKTHYDKILMRDGSMIDAKVYQISGKLVKFKNETSGGLNDELPISDIYMIKYATKGTMFITKEGNRKTADSQEIDSKATVIYTTDYREIPCYGVEFDVDKLHYSTQSKAKKGKSIPKFSLPLSEVFMIFYPDDTSEIVSELDQETAIENPIVNEEPADELKVVFHKVKKGESASQIARAYNVNVEDIIEWNDLDKNIKTNMPLKIGLELMLYVKK